MQTNYLVTSVDVSNFVLQDVTIQIVRTELRWNNDEMVIKEEDHMDDPFKNAEVIYSYSLEQSIADGFHVKLFENRWKELSGNRPIVATIETRVAFSDAAFMEMWNDYVKWRQKGIDDIFVTKMNNQDVWVIDDGVAITFLHPHEY